MAMTISPATFPAFMHSNNVVASKTRDEKDDNKIKMAMTISPATFPAFMHSKNVVASKTRDEKDDIKIK